MEIDTGGLRRRGRAGTETGGTKLTQYVKLQGAEARLVMDQEAMHAAKTSKAIVFEDLEKHLHESQRQHHLDVQDLTKDITKR